MDAIPDPLIIGWRKKKKERDIRKANEKTAKKLKKERLLEKEEKLKQAQQKYDGKKLDYHYDGVPIFPQSKKAENMNPEDLAII